HGEIIVHGTVVIFRDFHIRHTGVSVIHTIVGTGFTFDTIFNDRAYTVSAQQGDLGHRRDVHVFRARGEEGGAVPFKVVAGSYQRVVLLTLIRGGIFVARFRAAGFATIIATAGERAREHSGGKEQCKQFLCLFHFTLPSLGEFMNEKEQTPFVR